MQKKKKKERKKIELGQPKTPGIYVGNKQVHHNINNYCLWNTWASQVALVVKNLPASAGNIRDAGLIPGLGRSPGGGHGNALQCSCLENPMDRGAWRATVHGVAKSQTRLTQLSMHGSLACVGSFFFFCGMFLCKLFLTFTARLYSGANSTDGGKGSY